MSRWTKDEDDYILEFIQEIQDDINYTDLITAHNKTFNTKRTETTYKARMTKIAKENNISIHRQKVHWTAEEKEKLVKIVSENPINTDWESIAKEFNRKEQYLRIMYNDLVPAEQHINYCMSSLSDKDIHALMMKLENICMKCNKKLYCQASLWSNDKYCEECHHVLFNDAIKERWDHIHDYAKSVGKNKCNLCSKTQDYTEKSIGTFNYDHINMFEKSNSIFSMNRNGTPLTEIYKEIDLCQLLCLSCHSIVTTIEQKTGFNRIKQNITKEYNKTLDEELKIKLTKYYSEIYEKYMKSVYDIIKKSV
jgi:hypothetical protein